MKIGSPMSTSFSFKIGRLLPVVFAAIFFASCASQKAAKFPGGPGEGRPSVLEERKAPDLAAAQSAERPEETSPPLDLAKEFSLDLQVHPATTCAYAGGPEIYHLGAGHKLAMVIQFDRPVAQLLDPGKLYAKIDGLENTLRFQRCISQTQIVSDATFMESMLPRNREFGPSRVEIFYELEGQGYYLGHGELLAFDTVAPPAPSSPTVADAKNDEFTVEWSIDERGDAEDVKKFVVEKGVGNSWSPVASASGLAPYRIKVPVSPKGSFRVVSEDCAGNRSSTEFFPSLLNVSFRGCGPSKKAAYQEAKKGLIQAFLEEHTYPWLAQNTGLGSKNWVPDQIRRPSTSLEDADWNMSGGIYCATISESIDRDFFRSWIEKKTRLFIAKGKNTVVVEPVGPGAGIFADLFKSRAVTEGYKVYDANDHLDFSPNYRFRVEVEPGRPNQVEGYGQYCWHVKVHIYFMDLLKDRQIPLAHNNVEDADPRIYASDSDPESLALQKALEKAGGNGLRQRVAEPMIDDLFRRIKEVW